MYILSFILKQHTPIIHFQHDQDGATLRATEVKPKLDRFIIEKLGKENVDKGWFNNFKKGSLDYKIRIETPIREKQYFIFSTVENSDIQDQIKMHYPDNEILFGSQYFADNNLLKKRDSGRVNNRGRQIKEYDNDNSKLDNAKLGLFFSEIECKVVTFNRSLIEFIKNVLIDFFVFNNFGCRQSKGFGGFTISKINAQHVEFDFEKVLCSAKNLSVFRTNLSANKVNVLVENISKAYKVLKSGLNAPFEQNPEYVKSLLFIYFCTVKNIRWEKRWIKQKAKENSKLSDFKNGNKSIDCNCSNDLENPIQNNYNYIRAVLGLAETNEFAKAFGSDKFIVEIENSDIERYQSPILIKVYNNRVYFICNENFAIIKDKPFNFKLYTKTNTSKNLESDFLRINTPLDFNITEFLNWCDSYMKKVKQNDNRPDNCKDDLFNYVFRIEHLNPKTNE
jgi:hypothetical protein